MVTQTENIANMPFCAQFITQYTANLAIFHGRMAGKCA
jgi:hypothetical protein